jgi:hypothetical protein
MVLCRAEEERKCFRLNLREFEGELETGCVWRYIFERCYE